MRGVGEYDGRERWNLYCWEMSTEGIGGPRGACLSYIGLRNDDMLAHVFWGFEMAEEDNRLMSSANKSFARLYTRLIKSLWFRTTAGVPDGAPPGHCYRITCETCVLLGCARDTYVVVLPFCWTPYTRPRLQVPKKYRSACSLLAVTRPL